MSKSYRCYTGHWKYKRTSLKDSSFSYETTQEASANYQRFVLNRFSDVPRLLEGDHWLMSHLQRRDTTGRLERRDTTGRPERNSRSPLQMFPPPVLRVGWTWAAGKNDTRTVPVTKGGGYDRLPMLCAAWFLIDSSIQVKWKIWELAPRVTSGDVSNSGQYNGT